MQAESVCVLCATLEWLIVILLIISGADGRGLKLFWSQLDNSKVVRDNHLAANMNPLEIDENVNRAHMRTHWLAVK